MSRELLLEPVGRLDLPFLLAFLGAHAVPGVECWDGATYSRSLLLPAGPVVVEMRADGDAATHVRAHGPGADDPALVPRLRHLLALDDDDSAAVDHLGGHPVLGPLVRSRPGVRVPGSADHDELLLRTIVGQQVSVAGARTVTGRLVALAGEALPVNLRDVVPGVVSLFPDPAALARLDPADLPMPRSRGRSVVAVGAALAADPDLVLDDATLLGLPGVGPWTAAYVAMRARRDPDVFLGSDLGVRRQLTALGADESVAASWAPFRSLAVMHLWAEYLSLTTSRSFS
jgi:AraC family transcriptional regulator of adaptative response / DNA-3-methyladenine glycosylase II